jgi:hypothetical protein
LNKSLAVCRNLELSLEIEIWSKYHLPDCLFVHLPKVFAENLDLSLVLHLWNINWISGRPVNPEIAWLFKAD